MAQLTGQTCINCGERISSDLDSCFCPVCSNPIHNRCIKPTDGAGCPKCGGPAAAPLHSASGAHVAPSRAASPEMYLPEYLSQPWYRRNGACSAVILAHLGVVFFGRCVPFLGLMGIFTTIGVIVVCISVLTGPVYYNKRRKDGTLRTWGKGNKIAAVLLLLLFVVGYCALMVFLVMRGSLE